MGGADQSQAGTARRGSSPSIASAEPAVHAEDINAFLVRVDISSSAGLSEAEAEQRLADCGPNRLPEAKKKSNVLRLLEQFTNPLVVTLLVAAGIAVVVGVTSGGQSSFLA